MFIDEAEDAGGPTALEMFLEQKLNTKEEYIMYTYLGL